MASVSQIKDLRGRTGAGMLDCKKALNENDDNIEQAIEWLRTKGITKAAKKSSRAASDGLVHSYIHAGGKIGVLLEINCETDFVARTDTFKTLCDDIAMHIAASAPEFVTRDEVSEADFENEKRIQIARVVEEGKPEHIAERIVSGRMNKWYEEVCLLDQKFVKDDDKTVGEVLTASVATIGENIQVRRFARFVLGEGLAKKEDDLAAEVAKLTS